MSEFHLSCSSGKMLCQYLDTSKNVCVSSQCVWDVLGKQEPVKQSDQLDPSLDFHFSDG
jgi:hypothetical protein